MSHALLFDAPAREISSTAYYVSVRRKSAVTTTNEANLLGFLIHIKISLKSYDEIINFHRELSCLDRFPRRLGRFSQIGRLVFVVGAFQENGFFTVMDSFSRFMVDGLICDNCTSVDVSKHP